MERDRFYERYSGKVMWGMTGSRGEEK